MFEFLAVILVFAGAKMLTLLIKAVKAEYRYRKRKQEAGRKE
jgi:hypothetical protein